MHLLGADQGRISPSSTIPDRLHCAGNTDIIKSATLKKDDVKNRDSDRLKVGVLTAGHISDGLSEIHGSYLHMYSTLLRHERLHFVAYDVENDEFPEHVNECDAYLLSGSVNSANDPHAWIARLMKFVRSAYELHVPFVGVCFGHQLIARALGGKVETYSGGYTAGVRDYEFDGVCTPLVASHGDQVVVAPPNAKVVGKAPYCPLAALRYGDSVFSVQPHPEFTAEFMDDLLIRLNVAPESLQRKNTLRSDRVGQYIKDFLLMKRN